MKKTIDFDGYNECNIVHMYDNGDVVAELFAVTEDGTITKQDSNIVFSYNPETGYGYFELTEDEINELTPNNNEKISE